MLDFLTLQWMSVDLSADDQNLCGPKHAFAPLIRSERSTEARDS